MSFICEFNPFSNSLSLALCVPFKSIYLVYSLTINVFDNPTVTLCYLGKFGS